MKAITVFVFSAVLLGGVASNSPALAGGKFKAWRQRVAKRAGRFLLPVRVSGWRNLRIVEHWRKAKFTQGSGIQTLRWPHRYDKDTYLLKVMPKNGQAVEYTMLKNEGRPDTSQGQRPVENTYREISPTGAYARMAIGSALIRIGVPASVVTSLAYGLYRLIDGMQRLHAMGNPYN